jgi:hypothetical protein
MLKVQDREIDRQRWCAVCIQRPAHLDGAPASGKWEAPGFAEESSAVPQKIPRGSTVMVEPSPIMLSPDLCDVQHRSAHKQRVPTAPNIT